VISIENLTTFYARNIEIIKLQTEGLNQEDSLIQLPFRSNCLNWVVGHVLANRCNILALLGSQDLRPGINLDHYERESDPVLGEGEGILPLEDLIRHLDETQLRLGAALDKETNDSLQRTAPYRDRPEQTLAYWLIFLYFHDSYHVGQTEILRQAAGKDDKII
jgi:hypothetical protein